MTEAGLAVFITSAGVFIVFAGLFIWGAASGQFRNVEETKYVVFNDDDLIPKDEGDKNDA